MRDGARPCRGAGRSRRACGARWRRGSGTRSPTCACTATRAPPARRRRWARGRSRSGATSCSARGQFAPGTPAGRALLAHELAHVVQQRGPGEGDPQSKREAEADDAGRAVASGRSFAPAVRTGPQVALPGRGRGRYERGAGGAGRARRPRHPAGVRGGAAELRARPHRGHDAVDLAAAWPSSPSSRRPTGPRCATKIHGLERQLADALADNAAPAGAPDR